MKATSKSKILDSLMMELKIHDKSTTLFHQAKSIEKNIEKR